MDALTRRSFICGGAALAAMATMPAATATGVKTLKNGKTTVDLVANKVLAQVGGVLELTIKKHGKVAVVRTSKGVKGFSVINLACPHAFVTVKKSGNGWVCSPPGHGSESPDFNYKVILVGDQRVGKTSLTNRAVFNEFND